MNAVMIDGNVGKIERKEAGVFIRLCHKESFFSKKENEWIKDESWLNIGFFGKTADAAERDIQVGDRLIVEAGLAVFPKEGPESRMRLNGKAFHVLMPYSQKPSPGGYDDEP